MHGSIIVVPGENVPGYDAESTTPGAAQQIGLDPGDSLVFGRDPQHGPGGGTDQANQRRLTLAHQGVSRIAGLITAGASFWCLSNLSRQQTYVVENPEGAGEHIKVAPGRLEAPVPFEFARVVLPAKDELLAFDVWAPRHDYAEPNADGALQPGQLTAPAFPLDRSARYFLVLAALCEPRLRGDLYAPLRTTEQLVERLRPLWPAAGPTAVQWNIDYLAVKLRLKPAPEEAAGGSRLSGKKELLAAVALRFDLISEMDLMVLNRPREVSA